MIQALGLGRLSAVRAICPILSLYRTNLEVRLRSIDEATLQSEDQKRIYATVAGVLQAAANPASPAGGREWDEIYKAESLIALLLSGAQLRQEIDARLQELSDESPAQAESLKRDHEKLLKGSQGSSEGADDAQLRLFLVRVLEALHWTSRENQLGVPVRKQATNRILVCLLVSFALLVVPYVILNIDFEDRGDGFWVGPWWSLFALWTALTAGLFGAFFSRLIGVQRQWANMTLDEVSLQREWPYTLLRAGVGMCGALIIYFFLQSGMAEGALFPKFAEIRMEFVEVPGDSGINAVKMAYLMPSRALALLTFWCFLAGFSELLVPNILSATEQQFAKATSPAQAARG